MKLLLAAVITVAMMLVITVPSVSAEELTKSTKHRLGPNSYGSATNICGLTFCGSSQETIKIDSISTAVDFEFTNKNMALIKAVASHESQAILQDYYAYKGYSINSGLALSGQFNPSIPVSGNVPHDDTVEIVPVVDVFANPEWPVYKPKQLDVAESEEQSEILTLLAAPERPEPATYSAYANPDWPVYTPKPTPIIYSIDVQEPSEIDESPSAVTGVCGDGTELVDGICQVITTVPDFYADLS